MMSFKKYAAIFSITSTLIACSNGNSGTYPPTWNYEQISTGAGRDASSSFDSNNNLFIAFKDLSSANGGATVFKYNTNSNRLSLVGQSGFNTNVQEVKITTTSGANPTPVIAFKSPEAANKISVMSYNSTNQQWEYIGSSSFSTPAMSSTLNIFNDANNHINIAYVDYSTQKPNMLVYDNSQWNLVGNADFSPTRARFLSAATYGNYRYVAYRSDSSTRANVMIYTGTNWQILGNSDFSDGAASSINLATSPATGDVFVAFRDAANGNKATVMKYNSTTNQWDTVGGKGFTQTAISSLSLAISPVTKQPVIAVQEDSSNNQKLAVYKLNGTSWSMYGPEGNPTSTTMPIKLSISTNGVNYIIYQDPLTQAIMKARI